MKISELFDRAKQHTGSHSLTARALGVNPQRVNDWKSGYRPCPAEVQDRLLVLAEATDEEIASHVVERAGLTRKRLTTAGFVAAFAGSLVAGAASLAGHLGNLHSAAMYKSFTRHA